MHKALYERVEHSHTSLSAVILSGEGGSGIGRWLVFLSIRSMMVQMASCERLHMSHHYGYHEEALYLISQNDVQNAGI